MATRAAALPLPPAGDWPADRLRPQLAELASGLEGRFARSGNQLADAIETIRTLLSGLDATTNALDADGVSRAVGELRQAAAQIAQVPQAMKQREADLTKVARLVREVEGHVADIGRRLQIIGIYGMNIKIAGAGGDFRIFVDDMAERLRMGEAEIAIFAKRLATVLTSVTSVRKAYAEVIAAQSGMSGQVFGQIDACSARLEAHLAAGTELAARLKTLAERVQDSVGGVLAAIQVADSTRQRIEHVVEAFDIIAEEAMTASVPERARDHLAGLIGALIDSAGQDHARESLELTRSLARLAAASGDLAALVERGASGTETSSLGELETGIAAIAQTTARLGETAARAEAMEGCIADAADDLTRRLESIDQIVRDVKAIGINTRLLCLRQGQSGVAVAVIAVEVATQATQLRESAGKVAETIDRLAERNRGLRDASARGDGDLGATLDQARGVIAEACRKSDAALADGEAVVRRLMTQLDGASAVIEDEDRLAQTLAPAALSLARAAPTLDDDDKAWLHRILPRIASRYTMAAERQIHAGFALAELATEPAPSATLVTVAAVEQDEDGLF